MAEKKLCLHCMEYRESGSSRCPHCGKEAVSAELPPHYLRPGLELNNKYIVGRTLGEGGFGITYIGRDKNLDMRVAIKEYYPSGFVSRNSSASLTITANVGNGEQVFEKGRERFISEARILAKLTSEPGIVGVRDFFEANNTAYIIMDYLDGITLKEHLEQNGTMGINQILELLKPVMKSLERIHGRELIHRDISPDNLMLVDGELKLLDFGAARDFANLDNKSLSVMLKPGYAPEEQYRSKGIQGPWTDVYALCATIYKCITGITPDDSLNRAFGDDIKPPSSLGVSISAEQEKALMQGMAILQKNRIQSIHELRERLYGKASVTIEISSAPPVAKPKNRPVPADPNATVIGTPLTQTRSTIQNQPKPILTKVENEAETVSKVVKPIRLKIIIATTLAVILLFFVYFVINFEKFNITIPNFFSPSQIGFIFPDSQTPGSTVTPSNNELIRVVTLDTTRLIWNNEVERYQRLRVRSEPNVESEIIYELSRGDVVVIMETGNEYTDASGITGNWVKISFNEIIGWCFSGYLDFLSTGNP